MSEISEGIVIGSAVVDLIKETLDDDEKSSCQDLTNCLEFTREISKVLIHN